MATDVVKASEDDLAYLEPGATPLEAAERLLRRGPRLALVTRGGEGAIAVTREWHEAVRPPPVDVVDSVGAGDAFGGAWLACWLTLGRDRPALTECQPVRAATAFACQVAALTCTHRGAVPPLLGEQGLRFPAQLNE